MKLPYHRSITAQALANQLSPRALNAVLDANLEQDSLRYQFQHDHFHFDSNSFDEGNAYLEEQRSLVRDSLGRGDAPSAWQAFGRLTHGAQDFYAHSNYVPLWLERFAGDALPPPPEVDPVSPVILQRPDLKSGKLYYPFEALTFIPYVGRIFVPLMPADSHARMNHDGPDNSPLFDYIFHAAVKRTSYEFDRTAALLTPQMRALFVDR
jgi:hypothetical protein